MRPLARYRPPKPAARRRPPSPPQVQGPYEGMWDSIDPSVAHEKVAQRLRNVYRRPGVIRGRPGFQKLGSQMAAGVGQAVHQYTKLDGTEKTIAVVAGEIYDVNWSTRVWTKRVSTANLNADAITLSSTARVFCLTIANKVLFSDGTNIPFLWDGTAGGGLTKLTNADEFYGQPDEYYSKVFGIKKDDRSTLIWSEENDPTTGYEAGAFDNAWTLGVSEQAQLTAIAATNDALYYFRPYSIDYVSGAVTPDFRTSGVRSGVSEGEGTISPASVLVYGAPPKIFFANALGQPHVIIPGQGVVPIWEAFEETISGLDPTKFNDIVCFHDPSTDMIGFAVCELNRTHPQMMLMYDPTPAVPRAVAIWDGFVLKAANVVKNGDGRKIWLHLSEDGYAYDHGAPYGDVWSDQLAAGAQGIQHEVKAAPMGYDPVLEKHWDRLDFSFRAETDLTVRLDVTTPRGTTDPLEGSLTASGARLGSFELNVDELANESQEQHLGFGLDSNGRWMSWRLLHSRLDERFGLETALATAYPLSMDPGTP